MRCFDEYDTQKIIAAKKLLLEVQEYNFGTPAQQRKLKRLDTIIAKIDELIQIDSEEVK